MTVKVCVLSASKGWRTTVDGAREAHHRYMVDAADEAVRLVEEAVENGHGAEVLFQTRAGDLQPVETCFAKDPFVRDALLDRLRPVLQRSPKPEQARGRPAPLRTSHTGERDVRPWR